MIGRSEQRRRLERAICWMKYAQVGHTVIVGGMVWRKWPRDRWISTGGTVASARDLALRAVPA